MRYPLPAIITHYPPGKDPSVRLLALFLSVLMPVAVLLESLHHHEDEQDHPDCAVCAVAHHHSADTAVPPPLALSLPTASPALFVPIIPLVISARIIHSQRNRAPPA